MPYGTELPRVEYLYFKMLCPQHITGLIIGKGGSVINQLNSICGAKIKLSQNNEFFPTTNDRVISSKSILFLNLFLIFNEIVSYFYLVYGPREGLMNAVRELVTKIVEVKMP